MVSILMKLNNIIDTKKKKVFETPKKPLKQRINEFVMRNFGIILLLTTILAFICFVMFITILIGGSCLESGNYYNHLGDVA